MKQALADVFVPSRLFIYYNERVIEGTVDEDSGAMIRDGMKSVAKQGAPHEKLWPYVIPQVPHEADAGVVHGCRAAPSVLYQRAHADRHAAARRASRPGYPFVFGFSVYESFESERRRQDRHACRCRSRKEQQLGGHAVLAVGYDDTESWFVVRNSWGPGWGLDGYFTLPYDYILDGSLSDDFWTVRSVR